MHSPEPPLEPVAPAATALRCRRTGSRAACLVLVAASGTAGPVYAQLSRATSTLNAISTWMQGLGVTVITIAVIWAGIKMIFGQQQMRDLGNVFWGSFLIGAASLVASFFFSGTST